MLITHFSETITCPHPRQVGPTFLPRSTHLRIRSFGHVFLLFLMCQRAADCFWEMAPPLRWLLPSKWPHPSNGSSPQDGPTHQMAPPFRWPLPSRCPLPSDGSSLQTAPPLRRPLPSDGPSLPVAPPLRWLLPAGVTIAISRTYPHLITSRGISFTSHF